jgi:hypothetical protein
MQVYVASKFGTFSDRLYMHRSVYDTFDDDGGPAGVRDDIPSLRVRTRERERT